MHRAPGPCLAVTDETTGTRQDEDSGHAGHGNGGDLAEPCCAQVLDVAHPVRRCGEELIACGCGDRGRRLLLRQGRLLGRLAEVGGALGTRSGRRWGQPRHARDGGAACIDSATAAAWAGACAGPRGKAGRVIGWNGNCEAAVARPVTASSQGCANVVKSVTHCPGICVSVPGS